MWIIKKFWPIISPFILLVLAKEFLKLRVVRGDAGGDVTGPERLRFPVASRGVRHRVVALSIITGHHHHLSVIRFS